MKTVVVLFVLVAVVHCGVPFQQCDRICSRYRDNPVCSRLGNEFSNECFLDCHWEQKECDGKCPCDNGYIAPQVVYVPVPQEVVSYDTPSYNCWCSNEKDYVCGSDGETYDNKCKAECENNVAVINDGPCPSYY